MACLEDCNEILRQIAALNAQLNAFVNGDKDLLVQTNAGAIKTLSGIAHTLSQSQYIQKIVDIETIADMNVIAPSLIEGNIVRVFNDINPLNNGLYQKNDLGLMIKIDYMAITDLWQQLPNPWNYKYIKLGETATDNAVLLAKFSILKSTNITSGTYTLKWTYDILTPTKTSFVGENKLSFSVCDDTEKALSNDTTLNTLNLGVAFSNTNPTIDFTITETASTFEGSIIFNPASTGSTYYTGNLSLQWYNADNEVLDFLV